MAIKQTISLEGLQQVQSELKNLADVGESAFARIRAAVEGGGGGLEAIASNVLNVGKALTSLTGAITVFTGITAALVGLTVSASNAGEEFENLGHQLGTTTETASALIQSFARAGADIEGLSVGLRRAAANIAAEWAQIQQSVREAGLKSTANNLAVAQSLNNLGKAVVVEANQEANAALQRQASAQSVLDAQNRLDDLLEKARLREGGVRDPQAEAEKAAQREREEIAKAQLQLAQAQQKAAEEQAQAELKAADAALARQAAQLNVAKAQQQQLEDQKNAVANLVGFVNDLSSGLTNTGRQVNATVDNIMKGIIASVGGVSDVIGNVNLSGIVPPEVFPVLQKLSDVLKNTESQVTRSALVTKFFGRSAGPELVAFLAQGSEAVDKYIQHVKDLQLEFTTPMAHATQEFRRQLFTLEADLSAIKNQIGAVFAPVFGPFFELLSNLLEKNRALFLKWANDLAQTVKPTLDSIIRVLSGEAKPDDQWLLDIIDTFTKLGATIKNIVIPAFKSIIDVIGFVASQINSLFGTNLDATSLIFLAWITKILGGFKLLGAGIALIETALVALGARAGIALAPLFLLATALGAAFLLADAAVEALFGRPELAQGILKLLEDVKDLGKKVIENFNKPADDANKTTEQSVDALIRKTDDLSAHGKSAGDTIKTSVDGAKQSVDGLTQSFSQASGAAGKFVPEVFKGIPTAQFATLGAGGQVTRQGIQEFGRVGQPAQQQAPQQQVQQQVQQQAESLTTPFQNASDEIQKIWNSLKDALDAVDFSSVVDPEELSAPFQDAEEAITNIFDAIAASADDMADSIIQAAQRAADAFDQLSSGGIPFSGGGLALAGGGRVHGPGSWTSDSIPAWLSRDEFVQPAHRVAQYGMDFMEAIRRGLLSTDAVRALMGDFRGFPRFAEGGAATVSSPSRTFNLVLGAQSFPLSGQAKVIDALEREATIRSMASTGIAQSFVGRR